VIETPWNPEWNREPHIRNTVRSIFVCNKLLTQKAKWCWDQLMLQIAPYSRCEAPPANASSWKHDGTLRSENTAHSYLRVIPSKIIATHSSYKSFIQNALLRRLEAVGENVSEVCFSPDYYLCDTRASRSLQVIRLAYTAAQRSRKRSSALLLVRC